MGVDCIKEMRAAAPDYSSLVRSYLGGSTPSGEALAQQVRGMLLRRLRRLAVPPGEIEEMIQDCMLQVFGSLSEFTSTKGQFESWVGGFAVNSLRTHRRKTARSKVSQYPLDERKEPCYDMAATDFERGVLSAALESLDILDRELLHMRYTLGMSSEEIASASDLNPPQVRKRISRAVERLRRHPAMGQLIAE